MRSYLARVFGETYIIKGTNAAFVKSIGALIVGDMHIGIEGKYEKMGVHFRHASTLNAQSISKTCDMVGAGKVIFLGDVKNAIGFPDTAELGALKDFFSSLDRREIIIAKGNHDGHLEDVLDRMGVSAKIEREVLLGDFAFMHGNGIPSQKALSKKYLFSAHGHFAIRREGGLDKVFISCKRAKQSSGSGKYLGRGDMSAKMLMLPAFNRLIYGTEITRLTINAMPIFRNKIFDFDSATVLDFAGRKIGNAKDIAFEQESIRSNMV